MTLKERFEAAKTALAEVKSAVEAGEKSADDLQSAIAELESAQAQIKAAEEAENLIKGLEAPKDEKADKEVEENIMPKNLGENFVNYVKESGHGKKFDLAAPVFVKAATDTQTSPAGAVDFATTFDKNVVTAARTPLVVRDLFGAETISGSTLVYLVEGAIQGAPAVTAEGDEKPQIHFAEPTPKTVSLAKIACHIKESDEYIDDYPFLASAINGRLIYELGLVEQNKLVTDLLATSGIQTGSITAAATYLDVADAILQAAMDVQDGSGFAADAIALNPADWFKLRTLKLTTNEYFGGGPFGAQNVPNLWGIPVCVTTAIAANKFVVGAFKTCGSVVSKGGISVEATNTNEDDFVKNLMTIRAEERLALAVRRPAGFKVLTKATT
jgi:HK97 family phage major capsid protein